MGKISRFDLLLLYIVHQNPPRHGESYGLYDLGAQRGRSATSDLCFVPFGQLVQLIQEKQQRKAQYQDLILPRFQMIDCCATELTCLMWLTQYDLHNMMLYIVHQNL